MDIKKICSIPTSSESQWEDWEKKAKYSDLEFARTYHIVGKEKVRVTFLLGGFHSASPKAYMDYVVSDFVEHKFYNEYIDSELDNPYLRIIIEDVNDLIN